MTGGPGGKLPGVTDRSTRRGDDGAEETLAVSGEFAGASAPPPAREDNKDKKNGRRRKENKRERFFSLRLTFKEHAALLHAAGNVPLGVYIRSKLFDRPLPDYYPRRPRHPVRDEQILGQVLAELGKARLANNLNQLAKAANTGSLPVTPDGRNPPRGGLGFPRPGRGFRGPRPEQTVRSSQDSGKIRRFPFFDRKCSATVPTAYLTADAGTNAINTSFSSADGARNRSEGVSRIARRSHRS
jgi:hypothetical protein